MDTITEKMLDQYGVTDETRQFLAQPFQPMFINGEFVPARSGEQFDVFDPATEGQLLAVPSAGIEDVDDAVMAARQAFPEWAAMKPLERQALLMKLADAMEQHADTLAELEAINAGKALEGCKVVDIQGSIDFIRYMGSWATKIDGATRTLSWPGETFGYTLKEPVGVVAAIVPWNWPLNMAIWKLIAPLTVGCTVVIKPAEITPISLLYLMKIWKEAGLPDGVINVITGFGSVVGAHLVSHPEINKVSFTGSTPVGKLVGKAALDNMAHITLELGGKSAMVAFEDADIDDIVAAAHQSVFFNSGQVCSAGSRLYVHRAIYQQTLDALAASLQDVVIGDPLQPGVTQGPQISANQLESILNYINIGVQEGARLVYGGNKVDRPGYFVEPTLFADTRNDMRIVQEEIFGPVLTVAPFDSEAEAVELANDNIYGLAASVFTQDLSRAHRVVKALHAGTVCVNTHDALDPALPFGGYKQSGIGKDLGAEQLQHFLETKAVIMQLKSS
ncbi:aldehyde dehydrogenase family protein [Vibrio sp.]|uniref:aldehyde dehydrogenase family protein n=1 Tax=Vibrio sp. TaxID=678 RepID=UPI003D0B7D1B